MENNLLLGIGESLLQGALTLSAPPVLATIEIGGDVVLAALRTPPHNLVLSTGTVDAVRALVQGLKAEGVGIPGVTGPTELAEAFATLWAGDARELTMRQRVYSCSAVIPPADPGGGLRTATEADAEVIVTWTHAFNAEANNPASDAVRRMVAQLIETESMWLWDHGGPVSMAAARQPTPNGIRIGYVYTPPDKRRRGYASAVTAGVTQAMFDAGYKLCVLYTDVNNPTSNAIYQRVGYEPRGDSAMWRFAG